MTQIDKDWSQPKMYCPKCGAEHDDYDGVGVAHCDQCGYCDHRAQDLIDGKWICGFCNEPV